MPDETPTTTTTTTTTEPTIPDSPDSPRARAIAAIDRLGWGGEEGEGGQAQTTEPSASKDAGSSPAVSAEADPDPLAELAAKVEANLKKKGQPAAPTGFKADREAFKANPIAYLEGLGFDVLEAAESLFEYSSLPAEQRKARATETELERLRAAEKARKQREDAAREEAEIDAAERGYLAHLESAKDRYPHLMGLAPALRQRYSYEVAQMIIDAGEDAGPERLAQLTERYVAKHATPPGAGARVNKESAVAGDRNKASAEGSAPQTITNHLAAESGSPAERDLSPEGRRAAAMRKAAALGW